MTIVGTLTFSGRAILAIDGTATSFPKSARIVAIAIAYADDADTGAVAVSGRSGWSIRFSFEGVAYQELAAVLASLADDE